MATGCCWPIRWRDAFPSSTSRSPTSPGGCRRISSCGIEEKHILKAIGRKHLPQAIVDREKYAFNAPGSPDLLRCGIDWVEELLSPDTIRRQGYFDPAAVETLKQRFRQPDFTLAGSSDEDLIMIVLTFGIFLEVFDMPHLG